MSWHVPEETMIAYVDDRLADTDAWSVEAHVVECEACRRRAAMVTGGTRTAVVVERAWAAMPVRLPRQGRTRRAGRLRAAVVLAASGPAARRAWLLATVVVLAMSVALDLGDAQVGAAGTPSGVPWLTLLAPVIPVTGVAAAYDSGLDDAHEVIASTPSGGIRLLLLRTVAVLTVTLPASLVVGLLTADGSPAGWLFPALALTSLTLAAGSVAGGVARAAVLVGLGWMVTVTGPTLAADAVPRLLAADDVELWLAVAAVCAAVVALRASSFARPPLHSRPGSEA